MQHTGDSGTISTWQSISCTCFVGVHKLQYLHKNAILNYFPNTMQQPTFFHQLHPWIQVVIDCKYLLRCYNYCDRCIINDLEFKLLFSTADLDQNQQLRSFTGENYLMMWLGHSTIVSIDPTYCIGNWQVFHLQPHEVLWSAAHTKHQVVSSTNDQTSCVSAFLYLLGNLSQLYLSHKNQALMPSLTWTSH